MSWIDKELKRRNAGEARETASGSSTQGDSAMLEALVRLRALWAQLETINDALPPELKLRREVQTPGRFAVDAPPFPVALVALNGACLGFAEEGIRYLWPEKSSPRSNNFWIRASGERGYVINRRVGGSWGSPVSTQYPFDATSVDYIIKCLVTGQRIKPGSLRPGRVLFLWPRR